MSHDLVLELDLADELIEEMQAALPFDVWPTPALLAGSRRRNDGIAIGPVATVVDVVDSGDLGGIMCQLQNNDSSGMHMVSLTHLAVPASLPFAAKAHRYQKRRIKFLKKQDRMGFQRLERSL